MGRNRFQIEKRDLAAARQWISRQAFELPPAALLAFQSCSSASSFNEFIDEWLDDAARRRLHSAIRQSRHRRSTSDPKVTIAVSSENYDQLCDLAKWFPCGASISPSAWLKWFIDRQWKEEKRHRQWLMKKGILPGTPDP